MNIKKSIEIYLNWKETHTISAYERYKIRLDQFHTFLNTQGIYNLKDITGDDVIAFHKSMEQIYSLSTIAFSARILKNYFWFWHGRGETGFNPKEIIPIRYYSADKDIVTGDDVDEMSALLSTNNLKDLQKKLLIHMLWDTGMRISELLDIKLHNIDKKEQNGLRSAKVRTRKSMRYNLVMWGKETDKLLNIYLGIRLCMETDSPYLFVNPKTKQVFTPRTIQRWIQELSSEAMLDKHITPHSFRHGKANYILERGGNVRDVSALLRHVKPESSFHYLRLSKTKYTEIAGRFLNKDERTSHQNSIYPKQSTLQFHLKTA
ncbi:MAG: tyrosine-type recombinase/integrase [Flavobacteriales bacterium]